MENELLVTITGFDTYDMYEHFLNQLETLIQSGILISIEPRSSPYSAFYGAEERWFTTRLKIIWLLIPPDYPFEGFFKPITDVK